jgi:hypothetical protein
MVTVVVMMRLCVSWSVLRQRRKCLLCALKIAGLKRRADLA